jgi:hypothetical protein
LLWIGLLVRLLWLRFSSDMLRVCSHITDLRTHCRGEDFLNLLADLQGKARLIDKGVDIEAYTMAELEQQYITEVESFSEVSLCLGNWLPGLNIRPLIPGDVLGIIAGTGQLKSAAAQNILSCNPRIPALFCQLEISGPLMFERGAAIATASTPQRFIAVTGREIGSIGARAER